MMAESSTMKQSVPARRKLSAGLGFAYATLGLRAGEARVDAIREAARISAQTIQEVTKEEEDRLVTLADVATSAYRLLDPRKRLKRIERIQLSIISERALELPQGARQPLFGLRPRKSAS